MEAHLTKRTSYRFKARSGAGLFLADSGHARPPDLVSSAAPWKAEIFPSKIPVGSCRQRHGLRILMCEQPPARLETWPADDRYPEKLASNKYVSLPPLPEGTIKDSLIRNLGRAEARRPLIGSNFSNERNPDWYELPLEALKAIYRARQRLLA
jgi:hypothetical protein